MTLNELAKEIGIEKYDALPSGMFRYYPIPEEHKSELCSMEMIERLQKNFDLFGKYYDTVRECWLATEANENVKTYLDVAGLFTKYGSYPEISRIKSLHPDGTPLTNMFHLFIHLPAVEAAYELYVKRGFPEEEARNYFHCYQGNIAATERSCGYPAISRGYFSWLCHYIKTLLFATGGFNFDLHPYRHATILKNKKSGVIQPVCANLPIHRSGLVLGSAGMEDEEGSFVGEFEETDDAYIAYPAENLRYQNKKVVYPKEEWEILMKAGDDSIGVHIPRGADITPEAFRAALASAKEIVKTRYPDWSPKMFTCGSWLLSGELNELIKPESKILSFAGCFTRFPIKDAGKSALSFIFPGQSKLPIEELPDDTSLMRAIKKHYLDGKFVYMYGGVIEL
ncbi:MAG: hypothetical protein IKD31_02975 [Clostridia bacterium]|nr:hypothetical protein [Clostridia bacterium]